MTRPVAIVAALPIELASALPAIRSRKLLHEDGLAAWVGLADPLPVPGLPARGPRTVVAALLGMGERSAEAAIERLCRSWSPAAIALVGTAGGCAGDARAGDLFLCDPVKVEPEHGPDRTILPGRAPIAASRPLVDAAMRAAGASGARLTVAPSITVNVPAFTSAAKDSLFRNRGAHLCEMENFWVARAAAARGVPFVAIRAIFDGVLDPLPSAPGLGSDPLWRVLRRRPSLALALPRLGIRMWAVRRRLDPLAQALVREMAGLETLAPPLDLPGGQA